MTKVIEFIKRAQAYTKFWVAVAGGVLYVIADSLTIPDEILKWVKVGIAIATAFSVYKFPNKVPELDE